MRVIRTGNSRTENQQRSGNVIQRQLLLQLVERTLEERGGSRKHRAAACFGDTRCKCGRMLFRNAGINVMRACTLAKISCDAVRTGGCGGDDHQSRFAAETAFQRCHGHFAIVFACVERLAERGLRILPMIGFALARMRLRIGLIAAIRTIAGLRVIVEAQTFGGVNMHYDRVVDAFDLVQHLHQRVNIIALLHIAVIQAECLEQVQFRSTI